MTNRYRDLLDALPRGTFYRKKGEVLPTRSSAYEFRFETTTPNRTYGVFVSDVFMGTATTDSNGVALVQVTLEQGDQTITIIDQTLQRRYSRTVSVRDFAVILVAHADVLEQEDELVQQMRDALALSTVGASHIEEVYGRMLQQPNDIDFTHETYRNALQEIRQAFRLRAARTSGISQAVHALTSVEPWHVPREMRPSFVPDLELGGDPDLSSFTALLDSTVFTNLNARCRNYVRTSFVDNVSPVSGPFTSPPEPQPLTVTFDAAWVAGAAGDVIVTGLDELDNEISDTFVVPGAAGTVEGTYQRRFASIDSISITALGAGAGTATVGLAETKFIQLVSARGPLNPAGGTVSHAFQFKPASVSPVSTFGRMTLDAAAPVDFPATGRYILKGVFGYVDTVLAAEARVDGIAVFATTATVVTYNERDRLWIKIDRLGLISVILAATSSTLAAIATAINTAIAREISLGATPATGTLTVVDFSTIVEAEIITITDPLGATIILEADNNNTVTAGRIPFAYATSNAATASSLRDRINSAGRQVKAFINPSTPAVVQLVATMGGTAGNVAIVEAVTGITATGMAGGTNVPANYLNRAATFNNAVGAAIQLFAGAQPTSVGESASAMILAHPVDGAADVFGLPRPRAALSAAPAVGATALTAAGGTTRLPTVPTIVLHATQASSVVSAPGPFTNPDWLSPVEVWFSPDYNGGDITVQGTDYDGATVTETIEYPGKSIVDEGSAGIGALQTGGRAANSPGTIAVINLGDATGAAENIRVYHVIKPGAAGNADTGEITVPGGTAPLSVTYAAGALTIALAVSGGVPVPASNTVAIIKAAIEALGFLCAYTGAGTGSISVAEAAAPFAGGSDDGASIQLTNLGATAGQNFLDTVRPGMIFRALSGTYANQERRIVYVGLGDNVYPPANWDGFASGGNGAYTEEVVKIRLESSFGASFVNIDWEIVEPVIVQGVELFRTVTAMTNGTAGTEGKYQLRIAGGVERFGVPIRIGRGTRANGVDGVLNGPTANYPGSGTFQAATYTPHPDDFLGVLRISGTTRWADANVGLHSVQRIDPFDMNVVNRAVRLKHEYWQTGGRFVLAPASTTDWSSFSAETGLTWRAYSKGEMAIMVGKGATSIAIAEPGLNATKTSSALVELEEGMPVERRGLPEGLDEVEVDIDLRVAPTALTTDNVNIRARTIPDGWRTYNVDEANTLVCLWGLTNYSRLRIQANGGAVYGGGVILEREVPEALERKGLTLRVSFWVEQCFTAGNENFRVDVDFGYGFSAGANVAVPQSATDAAATGYGGGNPTLVQRSIEIPTDVTRCVVQLRHAAVTANGSRLFLEKAIFEVTTHTGFYLGQNTVGRTETQAQFGEVLYVWCPDVLTANEAAGLGVPTDGRTTVDSPGHIDRIVNAHGYWDRADVTEYSGATPLNVKGLYTEAQWLTATLTNLEVVIETPARMSYARPTRASMVRGTELTIVAPSNATLPALTSPSTATSAHEAPFPKAATGTEQLYEDGVPVPSTAYPGTKASAQIGTAGGTNRTVTITVDEAGAAGNGYTVTVDAGVGTNRPMSASINKTTGAITVLLAARDGALLAAENKALMVALAINALEGVAATHLPGDGSSSLVTAEGPIAFTGAQATPWRFLNATTVQLASLAAGDASSVYQYPEGILGVPSATPIYDPTKSYTLDYEVMMRAESPVIDLGADYDDYLWLVDAAIYRRIEPEVFERAASAPLLFSTSFRAQLSEPAARRQSTARMFRDNGLVRQEVSRANWGFVDQRTVRLSPDQFDADSVYTLEYMAEVGRFEHHVTYVIETRSAATSLGVASAAYRTVQQNEATGRPNGVTPHRYHQLRITIHGVRDTRDIRVKSLGLKGVNLYGANPNAPGIITGDDE